MATVSGVSDPAVENGEDSGPDPDVYLAPGDGLQTKK